MSATGRRHRRCRWAAMRPPAAYVLGLGVRGIELEGHLEIERLPTGRPSVRLHGRAAARADQLGTICTAISITHESDYAVAIAFGIRTASGRYVFPLDIEERLLRPGAPSPGPDGTAPGVTTDGAQTVIRDRADRPLAR